MLTDRLLTIPFLPFEFLVTGHSRSFLDHPVHDIA